MCTADLRGHDIGFKKYIAEGKSNSVASVDTVCYRYVSSLIAVLLATSVSHQQMLLQYERHLPSKLGGDTPRSDQRLRNDLLGMLVAINVGWSPALVTTVGERCVKVLTSALWHIDPCHKQFHD